MRKEFKLSDKIIKVTWNPPNCEGETAHMCYALDVKEFIRLLKEYFNGKHMGDKIDKLAGDLR